MLVSGHDHIDKKRPSLIKLGRSPDPTCYTVVTHNNLLKKKKNDPNLIPPYNYLMEDSENKLTIISTTKS